MVQFNVGHLMLASLVGWVVDWPIGWLVALLAGCLRAWSVDWLVGRRAWLMHCLSNGHVERTT